MPSRRWSAAGSRWTSLGCPIQESRCRTSPVADPVEEVTAADILLLRAEILRPGLPLEESMYPQDDSPEARHLAVRLSGARIVGCATFFPDPWEGSSPPPAD